MEIVIIVPLMLLTIVLMLGVISKYNPTRVALLGGIGMTLVASLSPCILRGNPVQFNVNTPYSVVSVAKNPDYHIVTAKTPYWLGLYDYEAVCANYSGGCPEWPKNFKLIHNGKKLVIMEFTPDLPEKKK